MKKLRKVVIPAAGLGTRGLPFTKEVPKELIPVIDTPALHFIVEECVHAGIEQVIFVSSKGKTALEDYFDPSPALEKALRDRGKLELAEKIHRIGSLVEVLTVRQKEPLGLGHAVLCARPLVGDEPFAVCLGDEIFAPWGNKGQNGLRDLVALNAKSHASVIGVLSVPQNETNAYGIIDIGGKTLVPKQPAPVLRTVEKPKPADAPSPYAIVGRYVFEPDILALLAQIPPGKGGEIQLTDAMDRLAEQGKLQALLMEDLRYDVGNPLQYVVAQVDAALHRSDLRDRIRPILKRLLEDA